MTWKSHRITTLAIVYAITGNPVSAVIATMACTLPDRIEMWSIMRQVRHRTITHWPVIPIAALLFLYWHVSLSRTVGVGYLLLYVVFGYLCHIFEDLLSRSGVPILTPNSQPIGLDLYKTKNLSEFGAVVALISVSLLVAAGKGFCSPEYLAGLPVIILNTFTAFLGVTT